MFSSYESLWYRWHTHHEEQNIGPGTADTMLPVVPFAR
jgi:hypothetical protein